jgi:hypothetical protein
MEVLGKIRVINLEQQVNATFKKRELVVTTDEQYPQHILIEFNQDKCSVLDKYKVGDSVEVGINLRGREWSNPQGETKYFNSIQGWKIQKQANVGTENVPATAPAQTYHPAPYTEGETDDLPF